MDQENQGDHGAECRTRSTVVLFLHFSDAGSGTAKLTQDGFREWVTVIEAISGDG